MPGRVAKPGGGPDRFTDAFRSGLTRCSAQARRRTAACARRAALAALRGGLTRCAALGVRVAQVAAYGACVKALLPAVEKGACEAEFAALRTCFFAAVRGARRGRTAAAVGVARGGA